MAERDDDPPPLPAGWGQLCTGDGRPYYVYYPTGAVQWERPKPPAAADTETGDSQENQQQQRSPAEGSAATATASAEAANGGGGGGTGGDGVGRYAHEDSAMGEVIMLWLRLSGRKMIEYEQHRAASVWGRERKESYGS